MVTDMPSFVMLEKLCEGCLVGKQSRNAFKTHLPMRYSCVLEMVHSYVCGPLEEHIIGGNRYFVSFIDEYSNKLSVYMIRHKDELFEVFKRFKMLVENKSDENIKMLRTDEGGEYTFKQFKEFCVEHGIIMRLQLHILLNTTI